MNTTKLEFRRARGINLMPLDKGSKYSVIKQGRTQRPVVKGVRKSNLRMVPKAVEMNRKSFERGDVSGEHVVTSEVLSMDVETEVPNSDVERQECKPKDRQLKGFNIEGTVAEKQDEAEQGFHKTKKRSKETFVRSERGACKPQVERNPLPTPIDQPFAYANRQ